MTLSLPLTKRARLRLAQYRFSILSYTGLSERHRVRRQETYHNDLSARRPFPVSPSSLVSQLRDSLAQALSEDCGYTLYQMRGGNHFSACDRYVTTIDEKPTSDLAAPVPLDDNPLSASSAAEHSCCIPVQKRSLLSSLKQKRRMMCAGFDQRRVM